MLKNLKTFPWGYTAIAVLLISVGVCFIIFNTALNLLAIAVGIILAVAGIVLAVLALMDKRRGFIYAFKTATAAIMIIGGIVTAIANDLAVAVMADVFCRTYSYGSINCNLFLYSQKRKA